MHAEGLRLSAGIRRVKEAIPTGNSTKSCEQPLQQPLPGPPQASSHPPDDPEAEEAVQKLKEGGPIFAQVRSKGQPPSSQHRRSSPEAGCHSAASSRMAIVQAVLSALETRFAVARVSLQTKIVDMRLFAIEQGIAASKLMHGDRARSTLSFGSPAALHSKAIVAIYYVSIELFHLND